MDGVAVICPKGFRCGGTGVVGTLDPVGFLVSSVP